MLLCLWNLLQSPRSASKFGAFPAVQSGPSRENLYLSGNCCSHLEQIPLCVPTHFQVSSPLHDIHQCEGSVLLQRDSDIPCSTGLGTCEWDHSLCPWKAASRATRFVLGEFSQGTCPATTMARCPRISLASRSFYNPSTQKSPKQVNTALNCFIKWNIIKKK